MDGAVALGHQPVHQLQNGPGIAFGHGSHDLFYGSRGRRADQLPHCICGQASVAAGNGLIQNRKRVTHRSIARFGEQGQGVFIGGNAFASRQVAQLP